MKVLATNRELNFKYEVIDTYICGIELKGTEVKSIRAGKANLKDGFALVEKGEVWLENVYIAPYEHGNINNVDSMRNRRLLLHKEEISKLLGKVTQGGYTLIPHKMGFINGYVKVELALCKGKKLYDKRESIKEREAKIRAAQAMKNNV